MPESRLTFQFGERAFCVSGPSDWNILPETIRATTDPRHFKKNMKTYYFNKCFN